MYQEKAPHLFVKTMFNYLRESFARKKARRFGGKYPYEIISCSLPEQGTVQFADWKNPLLPSKQVTQSEVNFFRKIAPLGSFCIDIGANIGDTTVPMALAVGKDGLTLAFEPNPIVYEVLEVNSRLNKNMTNIIPFRYAVTEQDGSFFYTSSEATFSNGGVSSTIEEARQHGKFNLKEKVTGINLVKFLNENYSNYLDKLSLIKIDVEGHDKDIIESISSIVDKYRPIIIAECFTNNNTAQRYALYESIAKHNYSIFHFEDFIENAKITKISMKDMNNWINFNFIAKPNESVN